jgi:uncharacterized protein (UPF0333 family)
VQAVIGEERAQTSLEYLLMVALVIVMATVVAVITTDLMNLRWKITGSIRDYRNKVINHFTSG